ncbi:aldose 1-epimerase family protein [Vagococcus intermedius]|uniref:Aldose 1-epimerase family protein n=1 Tax=Vagococcus intermedius TaxID=2991418 RepID=A0AAF0CW98_9ENTE|nr:aldose 1-epimerase family protein [Vagococcus intermedius]WEG74178.1 aldose 1-epimerase family protein [Vagococcus intermedius]WEG76258.1 aldose 1-epimerase family protein [Vagococcus intermedius]
MNWTIENEKLTASFKQKGGELTSLKSKETGIEYLWQGDPKFWARQAPVLFPFVGRLKNDSYVYNNNSYDVGQHGFARDLDFEVYEQTAEALSLVLRSSDTTKKMYPFDFELILSYHLEGSSLVCGYEVRNLSTEIMYFSIGGHPAFNLPLDETSQFTDYYFRFAPKKSRIQLPLVGPYVDLENKTLGQTNTDIAISHDLFKNDALIFETPGSQSISICSDKSVHSITLSYTDMPYVGLWSPNVEDAPFVCIEPWCGIADTVSTKGTLEDKLGINRLDKNETFLSDYTITLK